MSKLPFLPLFVDDYLSDTTHLSDIEFAAYTRLLIHYWRKRSLPTDEITLSKIACRTRSNWPKVRAVVATFFDVDWKNKRMEAEIERRALVESTRRESAKVGGRVSAEVRRANALKNKGPNQAYGAPNGQANGKHTLRHTVHHTVKQNPTYPHIEESKKERKTVEDRGRARNQTNGGGKVKKADFWGEGWSHPAAKALDTFAREHGLPLCHITNPDREAIFALMKEGYRIEEIFPAMSEALQQLPDANWDRWSKFVKPIKMRCRAIPKATHLDNEAGLQ